MAKHTRTRKTNRKIARKLNRNSRKVKAATKKTARKLNALLDLGFVQSDFQAVGDIVIPDKYYRRFKTSIAQLDQVLGEGFLPGATFTLAGEPGAGKTRLMLQMLSAIARSTGKRVAYASGEENQYQLAYVAKQLGVDNVLIAHRTDIDQLMADVVRLQLDLLILDSFQAMTTQHHTGNAAEKYMVSRIVQTAQQSETVIGVIMHITKGGKYKGGTIVPHTVDMNAMLTHGDEEMFGTDQARVLEITKNRFGGAGDAVFYMTPKGFDLETDMNKIKEIRATNMAKASTKKLGNGKEKLTAAILEKAAEGNRGINLTDAVNIAGNYYRGRNMLKELEAFGKLTKFGRGDEAIWTVTPAPSTVTL